MKKTLDQCFELEDSRQRKADCRVRVFVPEPWLGRVKLGESFVDRRAVADAGMLAGRG